MKTNITYLTLSIFFFFIPGYVTNVNADSVDARCDIYPGGEDQASATIPCTFSWGIPLAPKLVI